MLKLPGIDRAFVLGRFDRAPIRLHYSFFFAALILSFPFWRTFRAVDLAMAVGFTAILFVSVLVHELAHGAVGRVFDMPIRWIEINLYGGVVDFLVRPRTRWRDAAIIIAGPASNLVLGFAAVIGLNFLSQIKGPSDVAWSGLNFAEIVRLFAYVNLGLCFVNLLPGFPLDGGRLLYILLDSRFGHRAATEVVGCCGMLLAALSTVMLVATTLSGFPIWSPPGFRANWKAVRSARRPSRRTSDVADALT